MLSMVMGCTAQPGPTNVRAPTDAPPPSRLGVSFLLLAAVGLVTVRPANLAPPDDHRPDIRLDLSAQMANTDARRIRSGGASGVV